MIAPSPTKLRFYNLRDLHELSRLPADLAAGVRVVGQVLPFRVNNYVADELIDWDRVPDDPIYRLVFPHSDMLDRKSFDAVAALLRRGAPRDELRATVTAIQRGLNPHPDGQLTANVPTLEGEAVPGVQHKYRETCLIFPSSGQTCHAYCTYCFRWPQFVNLGDLKFATDESHRFEAYIRQHSEISDVLITGGDPMIMTAKRLACYVEPLLGPGYEHVQTIRIGTKSLAYWPYRFTTDNDADDVLRLFERVVGAGKHLAVMAHFSHWRELSTDAVRSAISRIRSTGAEIRAQSPVVRHVNDSPDVWARMWRDEVRRGLVPYYMFVARETSGHDYFAVPLARAHDIFRQAYSRVSGLARTVRGPSMSALPGKVLVDGVAEVRGERVFVLSLLQGRDPDWCRRPFFARYDERATWLSELRPAFGEREFFYERALREYLGRKAGP
jgi:KamA family protein